MGSRTVNRPDVPHTHGPNGDDGPMSADQVAVDAGRIIKRLQSQRTEHLNQIDFLQAALEESQEREAAMLQRIAELEDKK